MTTRIIDTWTDGVVVIQTYGEIWTWDEKETIKKRLWLYGHPPQAGECKRMRDIAGWDDGPRQEDGRSWTAADIDMMMQQWIASVPVGSADANILTAVRHVLLGSLTVNANGVYGQYFFTGHIRYQVLMKLMHNIEDYLKNTVHQGRYITDVDGTNKVTDETSLCNKVSGLSI